MTAPVRGYPQTVSLDMILETATAALGLPAPETIEFADQELVDAYRAFCATLTAVSETALLCDGEFFSGVVKTARGGGTIDVPRLKLLAALVRPGHAQTAHMRRHTFALDDLPVGARATCTTITSPRRWRSSENSASRLNALRCVQSEALVKCSAHLIASFPPGRGWTGITTSR